jgi:nickel-dependent lactate racemase
MKITVPYGEGNQEAILADDISLQIIDPPCAPPEKTPEELLKDALDHPICSARLEEMVTPQDTVLIVVNDHTRPGPNIAILKELSARLAQAGVPDNNITIIFATGSHRAPTLEEQKNIIDEEALKRFRVISHACEDYANIVSLGKTSSGLEITVNRAVVEHSFIITTGLIAPHHSAGFSGGRKSILPGVTGLETLKIHHSLKYRPYEPAMGWLEGNPFHEAALEAAKRAKVRFIVNAVQDPHKQNIAFVAGDLEAAHKAGTELCRAVASVEVAQSADMVITSPGGYPRDRNLWQSQKALSVAERVADPKGCTFILMASCIDGLGDGAKMMHDWMVEAKNPQEVVERFRREGFNVGSNKAFMLARALIKGKVIVVTPHIPAETLHAMMLDWAPDLQTALDIVCGEKKPKHVIVFPKAVSVIPTIIE